MNLNKKELSGKVKFFEKHLDNRFINRYSRPLVLATGLNESNKYDYTKNSKDGLRLLKKGGYRLTTLYLPLVMNLNLYFCSHLCCITNKAKKSKYWLAYGLQKPKLWSLIDKDILQKIIFNKLNSQKQYFKDELLLTDIAELLCKTLERRYLNYVLNEYINFNVYLEEGEYYLLHKDKEKKTYNFNLVYYQYKSYIYPLNSMRFDKHYLVVLDKEDKVSLEDQITKYEKKQ